jgi:hypothetical protein
MASRYTRREANKRWYSDICTYMWVWHNWITSGYRKAGDIPLTDLHLKTARGDVMCFNNSSPWRVRKLQEIASKLYRMSNEETPLFVTFKNFRRIQEIERG